MDALTAVTGAGINAPLVQLLMWAMIQAGYLPLFVTRTVCPVRHQAAGVVAEVNEIAYWIIYISARILIKNFFGGIYYVAV